MQSQDAHTAWPCHLQQRLGRGFSSSYCEWRCWCTPDRIRSHCVWILSPRRLQVRWLWALQTTIYKLPWLRKCIEKPDSHLSSFICSCRVLCRYRTLPIGSNENSARLRTNVCLRSLQRVWKDCPTRRSRCLLFRIRPYSIQTVSPKPNKAEMPRAIKFWLRSWVKGPIYHGEIRSLRKGVGIGLPANRQIDDVGSDGHGHKSWLRSHGRFRRGNHLATGWYHVEQNQQDKGTSRWGYHKPADQNCQRTRHSRKLYGSWRPFVYGRDSDRYDFSKSAYKNQHLRVNFNYSWSICHLRRHQEVSRCDGWCWDCKVEIEPCNMSGILVFSVLCFLLCLNS